MDKIKLDFELVPDSCWFSNLRSILTAKQWDFLKKDAKIRANNKCMICGRQTTRLEAHEKWEYDEQNCVQKLVDIVSVCKDCHSVIHIGRTQLLGDIERAENHYIKVNNCTYAEYIQNLGRANQKHQRLNQIKEWKLDVSWLNRYVNK